MEILLCLSFTSSPKNLSTGFLNCKQAERGGRQFAQKFVEKVNKNWYYCYGRLLFKYKNNVFCNKYDKDKYYKEKRKSKWKG